MDREKVSVSLDADLLAEARERCRGRATLSSYLNEALKRRLLAERQAEFLDALDAEFGPVPPDEAAAAQRWWAELRETL